MNRTCKTEIGLALGLAVLAFGGCATPPPPIAVVPPPPAPQKQELGRAEGIVVVRAKAGDTRASLAQRFLGSSLESQRIVPMDETVSPETPLHPGSPIVVALSPRDPGGTLQHPAQSVAILCYHRFTPRASTNSKMEVSASNFELQLRYLKEHGYRVVPLKRLVGFLDGREDLPPNAVVLTIDDGYRSFYQVAFPLLQKYQIPATIFPYANFMGAGDALTWAQLQAIQASGLVDVEAHSKSHGDLTQRQRGENAASYGRRVASELDTHQLVRALGAEPPTVFAYPYGAANDTVLRNMAGSSWRLGLTVLRGRNPSWSDPLLLHRDMVFGSDTLEMFAKRLEASGSSASPE